MHRCRVSALHPFLVVLSHFIVASCRGISFEEEYDDTLIIEQGKKVNYENRGL